MAKPSPCGAYGDILNKGYINTTDPLIIANYVNGVRTLTPEQLVRADVGGDGVVTTTDARFITDYLNGDEVTFPVCNMQACPWDLNGDGVVDDADRDIFMAAFDSGPGDANWNPACDFNGDGVVDIVDLGAMGAHLGPCPSAERVIFIDVPVGAVLTIDEVEIL